MKVNPPTSPAIRLDPALGLLAIFAFLIPLLSGIVPTEAGSVSSDTVSILKAATLSSDIPTFAHALCGLILVGAAGVLLFSRRVFQLPQAKITMCLLVFLGLIVLSAAESHFKYLSIPEAGEWTLSGVAFFAAVAILGRRRGPALLVWVIFIAIAILARNGAIEYRLAALGGDPTWRIFGGWTPNTQASIQMVGIFLGIALLISQRPAPAVIVLVLTGLMGYVLVHTGSKGGILTLAAILAFLGVGLALLRYAPKMLVQFGRLTWGVVVLITFLPALIGKTPTSVGAASTTGSASGGALGRLANAGATMDQSVGFRELLWKSSLHLVKQYPAGVGIGAFGPYSAQPGLVTQTDLAHNSILQLAVEASPLAALALLAFLFLWLDFVMRSFGAAPAPQNRLRLGIVAAVLAAFTHSATESNFYTFGLSATVFLLMGVAVQLSDDASTPEFGQTAARVICAGIVACAGVALAWGGWAEVQIANFHDAVASGSPTEAKAANDGLVALGFNSGEAWEIHADLTQDPQERIEDLQQSVAFSPVPKYFRALATLESQAGDSDKAVEALNQALLWDPNNMAALSALMKVEDGAGQHAAAVATAQRLISVENGPYFSIRSIPQVVPVETYDARVFLARDTKDAAQKIDLLLLAVAGFNEYLTSTVPMAQNNLKADPTGNLGNEASPKVAAEVMSRAVQAADALRDAYRAEGKPSDAASAGREADAFATAMGALSVTK